LTIKLESTELAGDREVSGEEVKVQDEASDAAFGNAIASLP